MSSSDLFLNDNSIKSDGSANIVLSNSTIIVPLSDIIDTNLEIKKLSEKKNNELLELKKIESHSVDMAFCDPPYNLQLSKNLT